MGEVFRPRSALFVLGFGADPKHPLAVAFEERAQAYGVTAYTPNLVDVEGKYTVVPPIEEQAARLEKGLRSDVVIGWSAALVVAHEALSGRRAAASQRLVLLNPSVRHPQTFIGKHGSPPRGDEEGLAAEYGGVDCILPGASSKDRLIAVTKDYREEIGTAGFDPVVFGARLLDSFPGEANLQARVFKVENDVRLGSDHPLLMDQMRQQLSPETRVGVDTIRGSHFLSGQEVGIMDKILSGALFETEPQEIWTREGVVAA